MNSNWSYHLKESKSEQSHRFFGLCDLEIWRMTLKNNRTPLLCPKKNPVVKKTMAPPEDNYSYWDTMTGTNSASDRLILCQNVEINSNWYFSYDVFSGMKSSTTWNGNATAQSPRKMSEFRDISNINNMRLIMIHRAIIDVILHLFIICYDLWCQLPFLKKTFHPNWSAVFGKMPPMCRGCPYVSKHQGTNTAILR